MNSNFYIFPKREMFCAKSHGPGAVSPCLSSMWTYRSGLNTSCMYWLWAFAMTPASWLSWMSLIEHLLCARHFGKYEEYSDDHIIRIPFTLGSYSFGRENALLPTSTAPIKIWAQLSNRNQLLNWNSVLSFKITHSIIERGVEMGRQEGRREKEVAAYSTGLEYDRYSF